MGLARRLILQGRLWFRADDLPFPLWGFAYCEEASEVVFDGIDDAHTVARCEAWAVGGAVVREINGFFGGTSEGFKLDLFDR